MGKLFDRIKTKTGGTVTPSVTAPVSKPTGKTGGLYARIAEKKKATEAGAEAERTRMADMKARQPVAELLAPTPSPAIFSQRTNNSTPMTTEGKGTVGGVMDFAKAVGQGTARSIASAGLTIAKKIDPRADILQAEDFESYFNQALIENVFGTEPNKSIEDRIVESEPKVKAWGEKLTELANEPTLNARERFVVRTLGALAQEKPTELSFTGIMGMVGLDLSGVGGLEKNALKAIVDANTVEDAVKIMRNMGLSDDMIKKYALDVTNAKDEARAKELFNLIAKDSEITKNAKESAKIADDTTPQPNQIGQTNEMVGDKPVNKDIAYHGTPFSESVTKEGFKPSKTGYFGEGVYLSRDAETSKKFSNYSNNNSVMEDSGDGTFANINTGEKTKVGTPKLLRIDLSGLKLQRITFDEWSAELEKLRSESGVLPKDYDNVVQARLRKPGYDGIDVPAVGKWDEEQILIYPESANKLKVIADDVPPVRTSGDPAEITKSIAEKYRAAGPSEAMPEYTKADEIFSDIATELELSEPGKRFFIPQEDTMDYLVTGSHSTFPKWIPENLRSSDLFSKMMKGLDLENLKYPEGNRPKQRALYDALLDEMDARLGVDTSYERGLIKEIYENPNSRAIAEAGSGSVGRGSKQLPTPAGLPRITGKVPTTNKGGGGSIATRIRRNMAGDPPKKIVRTETQVLKTKLREQAKGARAGKKAGRTEARIEILAKLRVESADVSRVKESIVDFVKNTLDTKDRGKALVLVRDAETQKDIIKAFARINRWAEEAEKTKMRNEIVKMQKSIMDSPSIAVDYKARVKELMGDFELKGHREDTLERLQKTREFLESEAAKGNDIEVPRRVLKALELLNRVPFEEITLSQMQGLLHEIRLIEDLGRTKFKSMEAVWEIQKDRILTEVAEQGAEPINATELLKPEIGERLTITQKMKNFVWDMGNKMARIDKSITPMDSVFDLLDGGRGTYDGANYRFFKGQVDAGYGRYIGRKNALQEPIVELATKHGLDDSNFERMGVIAAKDQEGGMEKLIGSGYTEDQVNKIILTPEEQEVLDKMRSVMDTQFPEIADVMRRVYNKPVTKVKNYFSFMTDWKAMDESEVFQRFGAQEPEQFGAPKKNVEAGFTMARVGGNQKIKINALEVFVQHTDNTSYLVELGETTKMLGEVARSPRYAQLVGDSGQLMVSEWIDVVARKGGSAGAQTIPILDTLRRNVGAGILGLKLSTIAIQPTSVIDGMGFIGAKYGSKGVANFLGDPAWRKFVANMPEITDRLGGEFALRELTDDTLFQEIQRKGFIPLQMLDQMSAGMVAAGAYERKMVELGRAIDFNTVDPKALAYAQLAVRRTQSSGSFKDVPLAVSRGNLTGNRSLDRAILQFQNFLLTRWSRIRHDALRAGINTKDPKKAIPIFTAIIFSAIAASGMRLGVNKIQDFITGKDDEDSVAEDLQKSFMFEMTGNVPFMGTAVSMAVYDGEFFPILDAPKGVIQGLNQALNGTTEQSKLKGITKFGTSITTLLGLPGSAQAEKLIRDSIGNAPSKGSGSKSMKTPAGLPKLPENKKSLPTPPGLPKI